VCRSGGNLVGARDLTIQHAVHLEAGTMVYRFVECRSTPKRSEMLDLLVGVCPRKDPCGMLQIDCRGCGDRDKRWLPEGKEPVRE